MGSMSRRRFLGVLAGACAAVGFGGNLAAAKEDIIRMGRSPLPVGIPLLDAHAHPDNLGIRYDANHSPMCSDLSQTGNLDNTVAKMMKLGMNASSFAAIGDLPLSNNVWTIDFDNLTAQLNCVLAMEQAGRVRIVRRASDIPRVPVVPGFVPGAILSVEGAAPLGMGLPTFSMLNDPDYDPAAELSLEVKQAITAKVDALYSVGVRLITLMHYRDNNIGSTLASQSAWRRWLRLTKLGEALVERMFELGIVVDAAHASKQALEEITTLARSWGKPVIDSHVSVSYEETLTADTPSKRLRPWDEMESIAATGGVVCTWPLKITPESSQDKITRETISDWAEENYLLKGRLGFEHIGLGTDGCGLSGPDVTLVEGWSSILNVMDLAVAMREVGFKPHELAAYMGGNLLRVLKEVLQ
jgi:microsomal dipeptidase-like Zn-dependent dipeptidase